MKQIELTKGKFTIVDDEDYEDLMKLKWHVNQGGYAVRMIKHPTKSGKQVVLQMHRYLMGLTHGDQRHVDHIDVDRLNNTRANLRICTYVENARNKSKPSHNTSGFKGVYAYYGGRWRAAISSGKRKYVHLGVFDTPEAAHAAYCQAADRLYGEFSNHGGDLADYEALARQERTPVSTASRNAKRTYTNTSGYQGVTRSFNGKRWIARIEINGKQNYLGTFDSAEAANAAYCTASAEAHTRDLQALNGEFVTRHKSPRNNSETPS